MLKMNLNVLQKISINFSDDSFSKMHLYKSLDHSDGVKQPLDMLKKLKLDTFVLIVEKFS